MASVWGVGVGAWALVWLVGANLVFALPLRGQAKDVKGKKDLKDNKGLNHVKDLNEIMEGIIR